MAPTAFALPSFSPARVRSTLTRLPLLTRCILLLIVFLELLSFLPLNLPSLFTLQPSAISLSSGMYRINTYPLVHAGFLHMILNAVSLAPLLERFEKENGTLGSLAMFAGPLSTLPAGLYLLVEKGLRVGDTAVLGASVWVFVLLGVEAIRAGRGNPSFSVATIKIPTWTLPLILVIFVSLLVPHTSLLGHVCAVGVGYLYGLNYLKILAPPEKILRWVEGKLNLLGRLPHYVSVDQKTYGRYGVLPTSSVGEGTGAVRMGP